MNNNTYIYLSVPFSEKESAKALGAKWDRHAKLWYTTANNLELIEKYKKTDSEILELKGEQTDFGKSTLFVDLIPSSCWFTNARSHVSSMDWDRLRRFVYRRADNTCECCGYRGKMEAHERWYYDENSLTQKLIRIIALCKPCHEVTHIGLAKINNRYDLALDHLMTVTGFSYEQAEHHVQEAFNIWEIRNQNKWTLDLSILTDSGIKISKNKELSLNENYTNGSSLSLFSTKGVLKSLFTRIQNFF